MGSYWLSVIRKGTTSWLNKWKIQLLLKREKDKEQEIIYLNSQHFFIKEQRFIYPSVYQYWQKYFAIHVETCRPVQKLTGLTLPHVETKFCKLNWHSFNMKLEKATKYMKKETIKRTFTVMTMKTEIFMKRKDMRITSEKQRGVRR